MWPENEKYQKSEAKNSTRKINNLPAEQYSYPDRKFRISAWKKYSNTDL